MNEVFFADELSLFDPRRLMDVFGDPREQPLFDSTKVREGDALLILVLLDCDFAVVYCLRRKDGGKFTPYSVVYDGKVVRRADD